MTPLEMIFTVALCGLLFVLVVCVYIIGMEIGENIKELLELLRKDRED